jgi:hypothetical protein
LIQAAKLVVLPGIHGSIIGEQGTTKPGNNLPQASALIIQEFLNE